MKTLSYLISCAVFVIALFVFFSTLSWIISPCHRLLELKGSPREYLAYFEIPNYYEPSVGAFDSPYRGAEITEPAYVRAVIGEYYKVIVGFDFKNFRLAGELQKCQPPEAWVDPRGGK